MILLKKTDQILLSQLRMNSRVSLLEIERRFGCPKSTSFDRLNSLLCEGIITRFSTILTPSYLSKYIKVICIVSKTSYVDVSFPWVNAYFETNKEYILELYFPSRKHLNWFKKTYVICTLLLIKNIEKKEEFIV